MSHARSIAIVTQWRRLGGRIAQLIWLVFAALALGLALAGVRYRFTELQIVCDTPRCIVGQPTAEYVAFLAQMGESIDAVFLRDQAFSVIAYDSILSFLILALGGVLIWQKPGNAVSVLTAFVFVALAVMLLGTPDSLVRSYPAYALPVRFLRFLMLAGLFVVFSLLPNGRFFRSWLLWLAVFFVMAFFFFIILHGSTLDMPLSTENALLGMLSVLAVIVVGASLFSRLRAADNEITRQQLKWILIGTGLAIFWIGLQHILYFITPRGMRGY